ncbi:MULTISPECIES: RNA polymerase sigma factor [Rhodopirellula]|uniref:RNA polymerase sigma factor n=1 Tax=Rhodopirellula TaxID=265488 RepID=UPI00257BC24B|nr:sigma-70 family RNA polymerase sigma factor [Rhodopirellula sp. UBA1907]
MNSHQRDQPAFNNSAAMDQDFTQQMVDACIAGDQDAMRMLYERCSQRVYAQMVRMVGVQDADDATQQVFIHLFRKLDKFDGRSKLETWVYRLASNEALQFIRSRSRHSTDSLLDDPTGNSDDMREQTEQAEMLDVALSKINPELRVVLVLKEQEDLSYREIADAVGIPEGTVGSRLNRARADLREALLQLGWE